MCYSHFPSRNKSKIRLYQQVTSLSLSLKIDHPAFFDLNDLKFALPNILKLASNQVHIILWAFEAEGSALIPAKFVADPPALGVTNPMWGIICPHSPSDWKRENVTENLGVP